MARSEGRNSVSSAKRGHFQFVTTVGNTSAYRLMALGNW
jgi:hypothetical protein